jgi:response regulator NasT
MMRSPSLRITTPQPTPQWQEIDFVSFTACPRAFVRHLRTSVPSMVVPRPLRWHGPCDVGSKPFVEWTRMRVLIVDESPERAVVLRDGLERAGYEVAAALAASIELLRAVEQVRPDVIIIDTDSPSRDVLEHVVMISRDEPRPIVMFSTDDAPETIRDAVRAGVSAYVVDGLDAARVKSIVEVAVARFDEYQRLRAELADANLKLSERKQVERAKGILMKTRGVGEDEAYQMLRRMAMDRGKRLGEIAQQLIDMADLLI